MSLLTRLVSAFSQPVASPSVKDSRIGKAIYLQSMGNPVWSPRDYANIAKEAFQKNAIAYRCVMLIAEAVSAMPFYVEIDDKEVEDHPLMNLLKAPNPFEGGDDFMTRFVAFLMISGNSFIEAVRLGADIRELYVLRPDRMTIAYNVRGYPATYIYTANGEKVNFKVSNPGVQMDIWHMKLFHPTNDFYGLSPIEPAFFSVDAHNAASGFNKALLDNMARPSGALVYSGTGPESDGHLTETQFQRLKSELETSYSGAKNAGRPMVLEGGLQWQEMMTTPRDMEFVQGKNMLAREIALSLGVPPMLLGIPGDNTYSNYAEANRAFYRQTVLPLAIKIFQGMTNFFKPTYGPNFEICADTDDLVALAEERASVWSRIDASQELTVNEKREAKGYDPVDGGDVVLTPSSSIPLEDQGIVLGGEADPNADPEQDPQDPNATEEPPTDEGEDE